MDGPRLDLSAARRRMAREQVANSATHGLGLALSVAGLVVLVVLTSLHGDAWHVVSCVVYGSTLVLCYSASTFYHAFHSTRARRVLKTLDHASIYLLIGGTYTPFLLVTLRGGWSRSLFGVIWGLALLGILFKMFWVNRFQGLSLSVYLLMGWLVVIAARPILSSMPLPGIILLMAGGLAYSAGVIFFLWERVPYGHALWHLFVLAGSVLHFFSVLVTTVLPRA